jgi:hypothetical protein
LRVADRRGLALVGLFVRGFHALHRVVLDRVALAQVIEQGRERRKLMPDGRLTPARPERR